METIEGNNIIAEFMGYKGVSCYLNGNTFEDKDLLYVQYHSSWNWLIPVIEKIYSDEYKILLPSNGIPDSIYPYIHAMSDFKAGLLDVKIDRVWLGVIKFIKWYNENNKTWKQ